MPLSAVRNALNLNRLLAQAGMESGNVETGFLSWIVANNFAYTTGYPLDTVERTGREIIQQLQLYSADSILPIFLQIRIPIKYFLGAETKELNWELIGAFKPDDGDKSDTYQSTFGYLGRLELSLYFGKLELAERMSCGLQQYLGHEGQYTIIVKNVFYSGLTYSGLARRGGSRAWQYRSKATKLLKEMDRLSRTKGLNSLHKSLMMKADILACDCADMASIANAYDEGIRAALKLGYVQDAALVSEIAGEFFIAMPEDTRARQYICQARDLYQEVGPWHSRSLTKHVCLI